MLNERRNHSYMMRTEPLFQEAMQLTAAFRARVGIPVQRPVDKAK